MFDNWLFLCVRNLHVAVIFLDVCRVLVSTYLILAVTDDAFYLDSNISSLCLG